MYVEPPPPSFTEGQSEYLFRMFNQIQDLMRVSNIPVVGSLPDHVRDGRIYYFTQIIGATITSVGFWGYEDGAWVKL